MDLGKDVGDTGEVYLGEVKDQSKLLEELNDLVGQLEDLVEEERYLEGILILFKIWQRILKSLCCFSSRGENLVESLQEVRAGEIEQQL